MEAGNAHSVLGKAQWVPGASDIEAARITDFARFVAGKTGLDLPDYQALWQWSTSDVDAFWRMVWEYFAVTDTPPAVGLASAGMPGARWFPDQKVNYVDLVVRQRRSDRPAIIAVSEDEPDREISWASVLADAGALAATLREFGVGPGDRVAGYLPNIPETVVALLAVASIGAVWSACGQDYPAPAALDRLGQLDATVLITADGYRYGGKLHDRRAEVAALRAGLPSLRATVAVTRFGGPLDDAVEWSAATGRTAELRPEPVAFDHPLWIVFSSGTTGLPKGIVHGHGGVLLEHLKAVALHADLGPDDTFFWFTSPSWMMWNFQVSGLLAGAAIVTYDGSPSYPDPDSLWHITSRVRATMLGTSPGYVLSCIKAGVVPREKYDLSALRCVGITGSTLPPASSVWLGDNVGARVSSISGGTDVVSAFMGGTPTVPVWPGELSVPYLGAAVDSFDEDGKRVRGEVGELVITEPMPSMPVGFWRDQDGTRYRAAYFDFFPGIWRHGDWITITDRGSVEVHGRSDSTLNRNGIRMGSGDIYQAVERMPEVAEALVIGLERPDGGYWMPLFVALAQGATLDQALIDRIAAVIRTDVSPRHVPDEVVAVPAVPHTRTGKKLEVPIKRLLGGADPDRVLDRSAVDDPELIEWFIAFARQRS